MKYPKAELVTAVARALPHEDSAEHRRIANVIATEEEATDALRAELAANARLPIPRASLDKLPLEALRALAAAGFARGDPSHPLYKPKGSFSQSATAADYGFGPKKR